MLRWLAAKDRGARIERDGAPVSVVRLEAAGLVSHDGAAWQVTALGRETVRANTSCRDGTESLYRPPAYYRSRHEDL